MNEEQLIEGLAQMERDDHTARDPRWEDVANARLDPEQVDAQLSDEQLELARTLFAPLDTEFESRLADSLVESTTKTDQPVVQAVDAKPVPTKPANDPASPRARRRWPVAVLGSLTIAAAAAILFAVGQPSPTPAGIDFPLHELWAQPSGATVRGTAKASTSAAPAASKVRAGSTLRYFLRPQTAHDTQLQVWTCLRQGEQLLRPPTRLIDAQVGMTLQAELMLPEQLRGEWTLTAVLSSTPAQTNASSACSPHAGRRLVSLPLQIETPLDGAPAGASIAPGRP